MDILCICGARPNFMKIGAVVEAMRPHPELVPSIVHTGQHYDERLSQVMFEDLGLPRPEVELEVGSASHALQTARIMERFEPVIAERRPDLVLVVGDVNSTVACGLVAVKLGVPLAHVEAGLRSFDRSMPEEINRVVTDSISDLLFVSEASGVANLRREGVPEENVFFVGNVMIDTLLRHRRRADRSTVLARLGLGPRSYAAVTLHRPGNVDDPERLAGLLAVLLEVAGRLPVVFPAHPRTLRRIEEFGLRDALERTPGLHRIDPLGYLDFLKLMAEARVLLTDSGGIQEEATVLRVPCLTLRENTERPATVDSGWNHLVGTHPDAVRAAFERVLAAPQPSGEAPERWDGRAGERIATTLRELGLAGVRRLQARRGGA
ncbi:MAG TPA: UDP-N-acetylglucosamine 2-epimerase (non-hydrolyzing) [Thermoanaerobaculia bacterium]|nr:UDP-N-acetylglucosamine 2-epimerase (non-hydrolyzing) [Thermoanaerobaculia bacterium]